MSNKNYADTPGVILINPKYIHNIGGIIRSCSCFGVKQLFWTGSRVQIPEDAKARIPREERMKGYKDVEWAVSVRPFDQFPPDIIPVAIEVKENSEPLTFFEHPDRAVYVFGPEDGSIPQVILRHCHRFVHIPSHHCLNLAAAVNVVLFHRRVSRQLAGKEAVLPLSAMLHEQRGETPVLDQMGWNGR